MTEEERGLGQLARGRGTAIEESDKALHLMCKMLCEGLPEIDELAHKLTPEDDRGLEMRPMTSYWRP